MYINSPTSAYSVYSDNVKPVIQTAAEPIVAGKTKDIVEIWKLNVNLK